MAATNNASVVAQNNWLASGQIAQAKKELTAYTNSVCTAQTIAKWASTSVTQDGLTATGLGKGLAQAGWSDLQSLAQFLSDPVAGMQGLAALVNSADLRAQLGQAVVESLNKKISEIQTALQVGGDDQALRLGENIGELTWQVGSAVAAVGGTAKAGAELAKVGIKAGGKVLDQMAERGAALNDAARFSYIPIEQFGAKGIQVTSKVMKTPQAQALIDAYVAAGVASDKAAERVAHLIKTGTALPNAMYVGTDMELIKLVPKKIAGSDTIAGHSAYFITRAQYDALSKLPTEQIANRLGLPAEQAVRGAQMGFDVYSMKPVSGSNPTVFVNEVAPVQQGAYSASGGVQQVLVPNRKQWTDPNINKIGEIKGSRQ